MARAVKWLLGSVDQLARLLGVSTRTARRRASQRPGAVKVGRTWVVPMTAAEYAAGAGVSQRTARRRAFATGASPTDPDVAAAMPSNLIGRTVPYVRGGKFVNSRVWPFQHQGAAWVRFVASGDKIHWYTGVIVSKVKLTMAQLKATIEREVREKFSSSPVKILKLELVYARQA